MSCVWGYADEGENETPNQDFFEQASGSFAAFALVTRDRVFRWRARGAACEGFLNAQGGVIADKSKADAPTAGTPTASSVLSSSATIACLFDPKVNESTFAVTMQYRQFGTTPWIIAGAAETSAFSISRSVSGLLGSTTYQFRMVGTRTTVNLASWESTIATFQTLADAPTVATDPASNVTSSQAVLSGTVDPNSISGVTVRFGWGTADGGAVLGNWQNATAPQAKSGDGNQGFQQLITGLSASLTYFFRAFVDWP